MSADLRLVHIDPAPPHPDVVALAEDILAKAKAGELQAIAVIAETADGGIAGTYELGGGRNGWATLLAGTVDLQHRLMREG